MIIISDRELSNAHGTGVLLKNALNAFPSQEHIVLCKTIDSDPDEGIPHFLFHDIGLFDGSQVEKNLMINNIGSRLYMFYQRPIFSGVPLDKHDQVIITVYHYDSLWIAMKFCKLFPEKKYLLFMMDSFIDFGDSTQGRLNAKILTVLASAASLRIAISKRMANYLDGISKQRFDVFFGPRIVDFDLSKSYFVQKHNSSICLVGNVWVPNVLPLIDKSLSLANSTVSWFTSESVFLKLKKEFALQNFVFGGNFPSEQVINVIAPFKYGLILYGLDMKSDDLSNKGLQDFSIPSKTIDYCMAGVTPLYFGPSDTACKDFLQDNNIGVVIEPKSLDDFFGTLDTRGESTDYQPMSSVLKNVSLAAFKSLLEKTKFI